MKPVATSFFELASRRMEWLGARQKVVAENVANADTPGFRAKEVTPFAALLDDTRATRIATTDERHISRGVGAGGVRVEEDEKSWGETLDGNSVVLEQQTIKAGEISEGYKLAAQLYRKGYELLTLSVTGNR